MRRRGRLVTDEYMLSRSLITLIGFMVHDGRSIIELKGHVEIESVEGSGNVITIWLRYTGSPIPQAVVLGLIILAIVVLLVVVAPVMIKWLFGEKVSELPDVFKYISIAITAVAIASIVYMIKKR